MSGRKSITVLKLELTTAEIKISKMVGKTVKAESFPQNHLLLYWFRDNQQVGYFPSQPSILFNSDNCVIRYNILLSSPSLYQCKNYKYIFFFANLPMILVQLYFLFERSSHASVYHIGLLLLR